MSLILQSVSVILWLVVIKMLQLGLWPWLREGFGRFAYGAAYPVSVLLFTLGTWYAGISGLPVQIALIPFIVSIIYHAFQGTYSVKTIQSNFMWDAIFLLSFLFMLEVRFFNPAISYAEKFMDHAFLASIMRNPVIPPLDPWYAGGSLNVYYYLGHWMMGSIGLVSGVPSPIAFNLILPTVLGLSAVSMYGIGQLFLKRYAWLPILTFFIVNPSFVLHALLGETVQSVFWESTRTISNTITEYPFFSLLWGDPHAHVISLFNQAFFIFALLFTYLTWEEMSDRGRLILAGCIALSLGSMPLINSWDVLVYAPLTILFGGLMYSRLRERMGSYIPAVFFLFVPILAVALYFPYYIQLATQGIFGVGMVREPSDPIAYLLVFGFFISFFLYDVRAEIRARPLLLLAALPLILFGYVAAALAATPLLYLLASRRQQPEYIPAVIGLFIITMVEFFYLIDGMGETYYRMNTVFKFTLIAWLLMGTSVFVSIGRWLREFPNPVLLKKNSWVALLVLLLLAVAIPISLQDMNFGYGDRTLDGLAYLNDAHPGDAAAIPFLRSLNRTVAIAEAEGGDYTYYSRISSFTGIPTLIGMPGHEQMWRGNGGDIGERVEDIRILYENPLETRQMMDTYGITHIYVGEAERERYTIRLPYDDLEIVYNSDDVQIYRFPE